MPEYKGYIGKVEFDEQGLVFPEKLSVLVT